MLSKRIIPCLDVKDGKVVKGVRFRNHQVMGDIIDFARMYRDQGADELVFYDITASVDGRLVDRRWISLVAKIIDIPFCVAGGIRVIDDARQILASGADKISINSPALEHPDLIDIMANEFGRQCVVVGIDSQFQDGDHYVYQYTGDISATKPTFRKTVDWAVEAAARGAGEIVLNCMNQDGMKDGYDIKALSLVRACVSIPLIASGGAGGLGHFADVFQKANVDGALAASVFHKQIITIPQVKEYLKQQGVMVRS